MRCLLFLPFTWQSGCNPPPPPPPDGAPIAASFPPHPKPQPTLVTPGEAMVNGRCVSALRCPREPCLDYDAEVRDLRDSVTLRCQFTSKCPVVADVGVCGDARYVHHVDSLGEETSYFDASGRVFARRSSSPMSIYCGGLAQGCDYGPVPTCARQPKENLVPGPTH